MAEMPLLKLAVICAGLVLVGSCTTGGPTAASASPRTTLLAPGAASLLATPLRLPSMPAGAACPVTPIAKVDAGVANPRGKGPFYLGGPMPEGGFSFNKMVFSILEGQSGPVLLRGGRIDGAGRLTFSGSPADYMEKGTTVSSPAGAFTFYGKVLSPGPEDGFYFFPSTPGCYAVQVDAPTFHDTIVIIARQGPSQS